MEQIKVYTNTKEFYEEISPFLRMDETQNGFVLGICANFLTKPEDCFYQSALFDRQRFIGALIVSRYETNFNFLPTRLTEDKHARSLFETFLKINHPITGIVAELNTANMYKSLFEQIGKSVKTNMAQGIYKCSKVKMPQMPEGVVFRIAGLKDIPQIAKFAENFHAEAVPHDPPADGVKFAEKRIENKMLYVLEKNNQLVACASWARDIGSSCSINFVYTPKEFRKRGYGSIVTAMLTQLKLDEGKKETNLFTDMSNPTSNKIYQNIGYEFVGDSVHYAVK